jgi:hypothetical protein
VTPNPAVYPFTSLTFITPKSCAARVPDKTKGAVVKLITAPGCQVPSTLDQAAKKYVVLGVTAGIPTAAEREAEKDVLAARAPRSRVEYTPVGSVVLVVSNVAKETQSECPVAEFSPLVPFSVASVEVMAVAALVVTLATSATARATGIANADEAPNEPNINAKTISAIADFFVRFKIVFIVFYFNFLVINFNRYVNDIEK